MCRQKREALIDFLKEKANEPVCVAFSGGIDSSLLLHLVTKLAKEQKTKVYAVTFVTSLHPSADLSIAERVSRECGAEFVKLTVNEWEIKEIKDNPPERCYYCKRYLFQKLLAWAEENSIKQVLEGTNHDDLSVYRPGLRALQELEICSPLAQCGFTKQEIRNWAKELGISVANRPSSPCMATRLPYGDRLNPDVLKQLDKGEEYLKSLGFLTVRLRLHRETLRIEILPEQFYEFLEHRERIISKLRNLGFTYITLDLEGFRSGSMDEVLSEKNA